MLRRPPTDGLRWGVLAGAWTLWAAYLLGGRVGTWSPDTIALGLLAVPLLVATGRWTPAGVTMGVVAGSTALLVVSPAHGIQDPAVVRGAIAFVGFATAAVVGGLFREVARSDADLHRAEDRFAHLRSDRRELRSILDAMPVGIVVVRDGVVRHHNRTACALLACTDDEVSDRVAPLLPTLDDPPAHRVVSVRVRGEERTMECSGGALEDGETVLAFRDLTDVRRQNEALRSQREQLAEQRERWETLMERADHFYFRVAGGRVEHSRSAPKVLVTTAKELEADPWAWTRRVQGGDRKRVKEAIDAAWRGEPGRFEFLCGEAGSAHWLRITLHPVRDGDEVVAVEGHGQDITPEIAYRIQSEALRRKEDKLRQMEEMDRFKTNFMHTVAHELSTPLTPLKMQVDLLAETAEERADEEQGAGFRLVQRNLLRLESLVKDMLDASRIQTGRLHIHRAGTDLATVVRDVCTSFEAQAHAAGLRMDVDVPDRVEVDGDEARLAQVLYNLLSNAVKFTPEGGALHVGLTVDERAGEAVMSVRDTGFGLTALQQTKLFVPFNQFHRDQVGAHVGTGMGLYICKGIVEGHGGSIEAASEGAGRGTTFRVRLPLRPAAMGGEPARPPRPDRATPNRLSTKLGSAASPTGP